MLISQNTVDVTPLLVYRLFNQGTRTEVASINSVDTEEPLVCFEELGVSFRITGWHDRVRNLENWGSNARFAEADFQDRLSVDPINPGSALDYDISGVLSKYLNEYDRLRYTYSERMYFQLECIIDVLKGKPDTRQAFLSIWDPNLDIGVLEEERVPCSIGFHFLIREGKLNIIYYMRSCDVKSCLCNDIYTVTRLLEHVALEVGVGFGWVQFNVGSLHYFDKG